MELIIGAILGAAVSLVFTLVGTPLLQDWTTDSLVRIFGGWFSLRRRQNLSGTYHQIWTVDAKQGHTEHPLFGESDASIRHFWTRFTGHFTFDGHEYRIRGKIDRDTFINGEWFDMTDGSTYHGVFQLRIEIHTGRLLGRWLGFSRSGIIRSGDWTWTPIGRPEQHGFAIAKESTSNALGNAGGNGL